MPFLDWMRDKANKPIQEVWKSGAYVDRSSGQYVWACVGRSAMGYHPGLTVADSGRKPGTSWGTPCHDQREATGIANKAFNNWIQKHSKQPETAVKRLPRPAASWER
jgi:hypothetical protein